MTDVNIAVELLGDAQDDAFDTAIIISGDSDLTPPVRATLERYPGKRVIVASLPLMNTSSMVSELAPVVLYLRHVVRPGETLIIEEPEAHLHPAMQVEFTRQIAALVHAGVRVIVTTHSEWVLEELANIVQRSKLPKARRKEIPQGNFALRSDQVSVRRRRPQCDLGSTD